MRVAGRKTLPDPVFNNTNINIRNVEIETLANGKDIFILTSTKRSAMKTAIYTRIGHSDQIHLKAKYYQVWENFLMEHGIVKK